MPGLLSVHIVGCGFGESVIVCLPNGKVGVIDCFSPVLKATDSEGRLAANPTLRCLRNHLRVERLAFIGLTHPHEDHGRGISHLLEDYQDRVDEIWIFDAFQEISLERYFVALFNQRRRLPIERLLNEQPGTFSAELLRIRNLVLKQTALRNPNRAIPRVFCGPQTVNLADEPVTFHFLGPSTALAQHYKAALVDNLSGVVADDGNMVDDSWRHDSVNHNLASPSILIEFGNTRILLGGDMERQGWTEALRELPDLSVDLASTFVKVSHHGSDSGYIDGLYEQFGRNVPPVAVLTPFNRHRSPLPQREATSYLESRTAELWTTSLADAQRSLGIEEPLSADELVRFRPVLERWKLDLDANPTFWRALDPDFVAQHGIASVEEPLSGIPHQWIPDLVAEPRLATLIHPCLRRKYLPRFDRPDSIEDFYRLSHSFDDTGTEVLADRYTGGGCGRLA